MMKKRTAPVIRAMKGGDKIVCITAYDLASARLCEEAGADLVLVGDSLGNVVLGHDSTLPVTMEDMVHHVRAVRRAVKSALLVADMPFGAYEASEEDAVRNAVALMKAGAEAVKLEGMHGSAIGAILRAGIPVMGHLGFTPQHVHEFGGHKVQAKGDAADALAANAKALADSGVFSIVLELVPRESARRATEACPVPTIGIGAGPDCDGQIQVFHDIVGLTDKEYRHAKKYVDGYKLFREGIGQYCEDVRSGRFPEERHSF
jgi:3-methyl-2-oxobutanoate hydroxymethyltransferase